MKKRSLGILGAFLSLACLMAQTPPDGAKPPHEVSTTVRVQVDMVSLPVVVTARGGEYVKDLKQEDFEILENGVPQQIAGFAAVEAPVSVALMLDTSGSTEQQLSRIRNEAIRFIRLLRPDDSLAALSFADDVVLWEPFDIYHRKNEDAFRKIKPGGLSAVYEAVWLALEQVLKLEYGRKALVLLSDGVDTRSETATRRETLELAKKTDASIYCIYFTPDKGRNQRGRAQLPIPRLPIPTPGEKRPEHAAGKEYLAELAANSGGLFVDASKASKSDELGAAFTKIMQELWSQYSIGYYPKDLKHDGKFR
ncbi:MAG: VWA domain-containing protein, partial [Acidobacteriota bacterium]|nr:VWA domain-containing protein [Acidobacteriota bacterium]